MLIKASQKINAVIPTVHQAPYIISGMQRNFQAPENQAHKKDQQDRPAEKSPFLGKYGKHKIRMAFQAESGAGVWVPFRNPFSGHAA